MKSEGRRPPPMTFPMCFAYFAVEGGGRSRCHFSWGFWE